MITGRGLSGTAALVLSFTLAGCTSLSPDGAAAGDAALAFSAALSQGEADQACALLAGSTRAELESSVNSACDSAILAAQLPSADGLVDVAAYGRNARAVLNGDVVFLTVEAGAWKILAAGCDLESNGLYDCSLKGS